MAFNLEDYTTVKERIDLFWSMHPMGRILTYVVVEKPEYIICRSELYRDDVDSRPFSTGHAKEVISDRGVNRDFALENCETSSVGIAMKNAKIGTEKNAISREEAEKVMRVSKPKPFRPDPIQVENPEDAWTVKTTSEPAKVDIAEAFGSTEEIPHCKHGEMKRKEGTSKTGKAYMGYVCTGYVATGGDRQCDAIWYELTPSGKWKPQEKK